METSVVLIKSEPPDAEDDDMNGLEPPESQPEFDIETEVKVEIEEEVDAYEPPISPLPSQYNEAGTCEPFHFSDKGLLVKREQLAGSDFEGNVVGNRIYTSESSGKDDDDDDIQRSKKKKKPRKIRKKYSDFKLQTAEKNVESMKINEEERLTLFKQTLDVLKQKSRFRCELCAVSFISEFRMTVHSNMHTEAAGVLECDVCKLHFKKANTLSKHVQGHYAKHRCKICQQDYLSRDRAIAHITRNHDLRTFLCPYDGCGKKYMRARELNSHITRHTSPLFKCKLCTVTVNNKGMLNKHMQVHKRQTQSILPCVNCERTFTSARDLVKHRDREHADLRHSENFPCDLCDRSYTTQQYLNSHIKRMHCGRVKSFECDHCGSKFYTKPEVRSHILWSHVRAMPEGCVCACGRVFRAPGRLRAHQMQAHNGLPVQKTHQCALCGKGFESNYLLKRHERRHSNPASHPCPECGVTFKDAGYVNTHYKIKHLNMTRAQIDAEKCKRKPRTVEDCFPLIEDLKTLTGVQELPDPLDIRGAKIHEVRTQAEKEFPCPECGKSFKTNSLLRRHGQVHKDITYPCSACDMRFRDKRYVNVHYQLKHLNMTRADLRRGTGEVVKRHACDECGKCFVTNYQLKRHKMVHTDVKYPCQHCDMTFRDGRYVKIHYKIKHLGIPWKEARLIKSDSMADNDKSEIDESGNIGDESGNIGDESGIIGDESGNIGGESEDNGGESDKSKSELNEIDDEVIEGYEREKRTQIDTVNEKLSESKAKVNISEETTSSVSGMDSSSKKKNKKGVKSKKKKAVNDFQVPLFDTFAELFG